MGDYSDGYRDKGQDEGRVGATVLDSWICAKNNERSGELFNRLTIMRKEGGSSNCIATFIPW